MYFRQPCNVDGTYSISQIHGLPKKNLYCWISPSITCSDDCIILDPIEMDNTIDPIVEHKSLLNVFIYEDGAGI